MTRRDLLALAATAAATFGLSIALFLPRSLNAGDEPQKLTVTIATPKLIINGCELSIGRGENLKSGQTPTFELVAFNPTGQSASVNLTVQMTSAQPASPLARGLPRPTMLWQESRIIALAAGQRTMIPLTSTAALPNQGNIAINLVADKQTITAMRFTMGEVNVTAAQPLPRR